MTQPTNEAERLYTSGQVASLFKTHVRTIARWAKAGRLSSVPTIGGNHRFRESDVQALYELEREAIDLKAVKREVVVVEVGPTVPHNFAIRELVDGRPVFRCFRLGCRVAWLPKTPRPQTECLGAEMGARP
jgi:excisionase family DNA binding protein